MARTELRGYGARGNGVRGEVLPSPWAPPRGHCQRRAAVDSPPFRAPSARCNLTRRAAYIRTGVPSSWSAPAGCWERPPRRATHGGIWFRHQGDGGFFPDDRARVAHGPELALRLTETASGSCLVARRQRLGACFPINKNVISHEQQIGEDLFSRSETELLPRALTRAAGWGMTACPAAIQNPYHGRGYPAGGYLIAPGHFYYDRITRKTRGQCHTTIG